MQASLQPRRCASPAHPARWLARAGWTLLCCLLCACQPGKGGKAEAPQLNGSVKQGKLLLARFQCGSCHKIPGVEGAHGTAGPPLTDIGRRSYIAGHLPNDPEVMVRWIVDPRALHPGTTMPSMGVSADDARHMAAYLYTLK